MKQKILSISLLSLVLVLGSCAKIKELLSVKIDTDFTVNLPVAIPASLKSPEAAFISTNTFDPLSNEDLAAYKESINGFDLTGITGTVSNLSAEVTLTDVKLLVSTETQSTEWNYPSLLLANGTVVTFEDVASQWTKINSMLDEQKVVTVTLTGNSTQTGVTFDLAVKFAAKVTAGI
jgi:hypothetical protein